MEMLPVMPRMIIGMLGGMMMPMAPAVATTLVARSLPYPFFSIAGMSTLPTAAVSAAVEPEIPAKNMAATMLIMESPPLICPTRLDEKEIRRREIPPCSINPPERMKNGMAIRENDSTEVYIL